MIGFSNYEYFLINFIITTILVIFTFFITKNKIFHKNTTIMIVILFILQSLFKIGNIININISNEKYFNFLFFIFVLLITLILVLGTLWIMQHLTCNLINV